MNVELNDISKAFGKKKVLVDLNCTLDTGGVYCLMGPSGMGKTTLLRILLGMEQMDSGTRKGITPHEMSAMFQEDRLIPTLTAVENVALVSKEKISPKALYQELAQILPENCLKQPIAQLSGGMKRRVALARAMHFDSKMVILDEPFTGLDPKTKSSVVSYVLDKRRDRILLVATHGTDDAALLGAQVLTMEALQGPEFLKSRKKLPEIKRTELLKRAPIWQGIPPMHYDDIIEKLGGYERTYEKNEIIWHQFETANSFGVLLQGMIQAQDISRDEVQIVQQFSEGSSFGEAIALGGEQSWVEIRAVTVARILFIPVMPLLSGGNDPDISRMVSNLLAATAKKLALITQKNQFLSEPRLRNRILMYFKSLDTLEDGTKLIPFKQKDLALFLGANRTAFNRELSRMKDEGVIDLDGRVVKLL